MTVEFRPRVALASLSGRSDAEWARGAVPFAGAAFLGGIAIDEATREAAREMVDRDRDEFLPEDPVVCRDHDAILEINAHCRQAEVCAAGAGETLLRDPERLCEQVRAASGTEATISVKVRTEVEGVNLPALAREVTDAGAAFVHVDAMDSEAVVGEVVEASDASVIANNGVRGRESVHEYLSYGADAVSVGRPSDDPTVLARVRDATAAWFEERGSGVGRGYGAGEGRAGSTGGPPSEPQGGGPR
ncbi:dihydropyrimidine dehydrogenase [Halobacteriales archaeon QH_2_66_30]|nr:MAG: dihydropyrimidine dehydrogenase [Halobacteriales archaeon QH_2_66_30]